LLRGSYSDGLDESNRSNTTFCFSRKGVGLVAGQTNRGARFIAEDAAAGLAPRLVGQLRLAHTDALGHHFLELAAGLHEQSATPLLQVLAPAAGLRRELWHVAMRRAYA
jgi:hypothetical protein